MPTGSAKTTPLPPLDIPRLRGEILGRRFRFQTPFGRRLMVYADYTASGRSLECVERYLMRIEESYANTHTEDDITGRSTTRMLHQAEETIKRSVNGNAETCVICVGTGATGAIKCLQEILGVYIPPATRDFLERQVREFAGTHAGPGVEAFGRFLEDRRPVVFVGPYEHHSNEVSWRESLAEVIEIELAPDGRVDLEDLERRVSDPRYEGRLKIGSFSAASNVTGILTPVYDVARILHRHGALACFDYAASAPYVEIDMNRDAESYFDAVFFSPHKFLGGPGASGVLLFNRRIYRCELPPTFPSGGTVDYVGYTGQDYTADIEAREKPGTPGTLQILRTMLALQVKQAIGQETIEKREQQYLRTALARFQRHPGIEILGNPDPALRIGIISFNVKDGDRYLHPKLATRLLNDLFGIQSRAGCSCAGPYGHRLLDIGRELSDRYRDVIRGGCQGIKPGWVRICLHYTMEPEDVAYLCEAVEFLAEHGGRFLPLYRFDLDSGAWTHVDEDESQPGLPECGLSGALAPPDETDTPEPDFRTLYREALAEAGVLAAHLAAGSPGRTVPLPGIESSLVYFRAVHLETRASGS